MTASLIETPLAPWEAPDFFQPKPVLGDYGYLDPQEKPVACSLEELQKRCRFAPFLPLVWTPDSSRVVTAFDVPALLPFLHERTLENTSLRLRDQGQKAVLLLFLIPFIGRDHWLIALLMGLMFVVFPIVETFLQWCSLRQNGPESLARHSRSLRYEMWVYDRKPPGDAVTRRLLTRDLLGFRLLTGVLALLYIGQEWGGVDSSVAAAGLVKEAVREGGEWWRLGTAALLHGNLLHILMNGMALVSVGRVMEQLAGKASIWIVFVAAALTGGLFSQVICLRGPAWVPPAALWG